MDHNKLRALVFEKTGIKIDNQDPIFALVALNDAVLSESFDKQLAAINEASDKLKGQTRYLMEAGERYKKLHLGETLSQQNTANYESWTQDNARAEPAATAARPTQINGRLIASVVAAALLSAVLVISGQWLLARNQPPAPAPSQLAQPAAMLTPAQAELLRNGEKIARAMLTFDEKTKAVIEAALEKP